MRNNTLQRAHKQRAGEGEDPKVRDAITTATGEQFYLEEWQRYGLLRALEVRIDDRPPPLRLNDDGEYDYEGEDND